MDSIPQKQCSRCKQEFPATTEYFSLRKSAKDGLRGWCRECERAYYAKVYRDNEAVYKGRANRHYADHRDDVLDKRKRDYLADPEKYRQKSRDWYENNPERAKESHRIYQTEHHETILAAKRRNRQLNPDKHRESEKRSRAKKPELYKAIRKAEAHRRLARQRELPYDLTTTQWQHALDYFNNCCAICGRQLNGLFHKAAADHWIPLNAPNCPGTVATNILPLCHGVGGCNNSKHDSEAREWLIRKFGRRKAAQILDRIETYFRSLSE